MEKNFCFYNLITSVNFRLLNQILKFAQNNKIYVYQMWKWSLSLYGGREISERKPNKLRYKFFIPLGRIWK